MSALASTAGQIHAMLLRPFRRQVPLLDTVLLLVLLLALAGQWHLVIERVEI
jgi:hypothetical protein